MYEKQQQIQSLAMSFLSQTYFPFIYLLESTPVMVILVRIGT